MRFTRDIEQLPGRLLVIRAALAACLAALALSGCLTSTSVICEAGRVCPEGLVCDDVHDGCAYPEQIAKCVGMPERSRCSYAGVPEGACFEGVCLAAGCGNGSINGDEVCDDGNRLHGDGCSADCLSNETCGNAFVDVAKGEACDDGNLISGDGCQSNCTFPTCGDGVLDASRMEQCDAGAANSDAPDAACRTTCLSKRCGDGVVDTGEVCDDGNVSSGDGCSADCGSHEACGNGEVDIAAGEQCDDGNNTSGDGCQSNCKIARCGDGVVDANLFEQCDTGAANADVADAACRTNCRPKRCGDDVVDSNEVCDDGNLLPHDGCTPNCRSNETCGNGYTDILEYEVCDDGDLQNHDGCNQCNAEQAAWQRALPGTPLARRGPALGYDAARRRLVMFGGSYNGVHLGDTWEWDGATWTNVTPSSISPPARKYAQLAYDASRRVIVMFGGDGDGGRFGDVWEWNGSVWVQKPIGVNVPPTQTFFGLTYDSKRHRVLQFPGYGAFAVAVWEWGGNGWTVKTSTGPVPSLRWGGAFVYDPARDRSVLFGGYQFPSGPALADTWEWDGTSWTNVTPASGNPVARYLTAAAYDPVRRRVVMTAGFDESSYLADVWEWDGTAWSNVTPAAGSPSPRFDHAVSLDANDHIVMFGGVSNTGNGSPDDTWSWNGSAWTDQTTTVVSPPMRTDHAVAYDAARGKVVLFGGDNGSALGDTWEWNGTRWTNLTPGAGNPSMRRDHALTYDPIKRRVLLFGGFANGTSDVADTWEWNGTAWTDVSPGVSPGARHGHALAYDATGKGAVLFGGATGSGVLGDTWEWNGTAWTNVTPASGNPPGRRDHALAYDAARDRVVLFGGIAANGSYLSDTWEWDGNAWAPMTGGTVPPQRAKHALAYDASRGRVVLFGGSNTASGNLDDTWEWTGSDWKSVTSTTTGPSARAGLALAYDAARSELVAFGGYDFTYLSDTWTWRYEGSGLDERCIGGLDGDGDTLLGCADPDCFGYCTPLCNPTAMSCDPAWPRCGDGTCQGVETKRLCPADCGAPAALCGDFVCDASETSTSCPGDCP